MAYDSTYEGKRAFVEEKLKPMIMAMSDAVLDVFYNRAPYVESVIIQHKNPEKNIEVNVYGDSIAALVNDVVRAYFERIGY